MKYLPALLLLTSCAPHPKGIYPRRIGGTLWITDTTFREMYGADTLTKEVSLSGRIIRD